MVDFAQLWRDSYRERRAPGTPDDWDKRAESMMFRGVLTPYASHFIAAADLPPQASVFDMGCGSGQLTCALAQAGHPVIAADFSPAMLSTLAASCAEWGLDEVRTQQLSWTDDWAAAGLAPGQVDVAIASRSLITPDLEDALCKLSWIAKDRVCVSVATHDSPRINAALMRHLGVSPRGCDDAAFVFALASQLGWRPSVSYLESARLDAYRSRDEARLHAFEMVVRASDVATAERLAAGGVLDACLDEHLLALGTGGADALPLDPLMRALPVQHPHIDARDGLVSNAPACYVLAIPRTTVWAVISWKTN